MGSCFSSANAASWTNLFTVHARWTGSRPTCVEQRGLRPMTLPCPAPPAAGTGESWESPRESRDPCQGTGLRPPSAGMPVNGHGDRSSFTKRRDGDHEVQLASPRAGRQGSGRSVVSRPLQRTADHEPWTANPQSPLSPARFPLLNTRPLYAIVEGMSKNPKTRRAARNTAVAGEARGPRQSPGCLPRIKGAERRRQLENRKSDDQHASVEGDSPIFAHTKIGTVPAPRPLPGTPGYQATGKSPKR
jgi:hypothetical protein